MNTGTHEPLKTPLHEAHQQLEAKIIDFGGWLMPVNYPPGIINEHTATRNAVGVFDVCHMGEIHFRGPRAAAAVQRLVTNNVAKLIDGQALYTVACRQSGGIVDDLLVYRVSEEHYLLVVNASNIAKDLQWFRQHVGDWCQIEDASDDTGLISFQGPKAQAALQPLTAFPLDTLPSFHFTTDAHVAGLPVWIARTGYTGEDGFEIFCRPEDARVIWDALVAAARAVGGLPVGLGARDTLRLECKMSLYGNDLTEDTTPLEAGLGWVIRFDAGNFIGKDALLHQHTGSVRRKLVGFVMTGRGVARSGYTIHMVDPSGVGGLLGRVTSGTLGPTVQKNIGMGYVAAENAAPGTHIYIDCRGKMSEAEIVAGPFYKRSRT